MQRVPRFALKHTTETQLSLPCGRDKNMQQTETYKLNLMEGSDTFSPQPLNENMEAIEGVLKELASDRVIVGSYTGDGTTDRFIEVGFTPKALLLFIQFGSNSQECFILTEQFVFLICSSQIMFTTTNDCAITDNGFRVGGVAFNYSGKTDHYIAIR